MIDIKNEITKWFDRSLGIKHGEIFLFLLALFNLAIALPDVIKHELTGAVYPWVTGLFIITYLSLKKTKREKY